ncbi:MAG: hypothetical protein IJQ81_17610 [Oscillibacter sp.]|nr:hypothetical protein [Oscillibacter sp.]
MRRGILAALALFAAFSLAACAGRNVVNGQLDDGNTTEVAEIPNPFQEFRTYAEARDAAGYDFAAPEKVDGYPNVAYGVMDGGEMFQIVYSNGAESVTARKAPGGGDISGDYKQYAQESSVTTPGLPDVTLKGDDALAFLAVWMDAESGYAYSLSASGGMEYDALLTLTVGIQTGEAAQGNDASAEGAWSVNAGETPPDDNPAAMSAFNQANEAIGSVYEPLAYLGAQALEGNSYQFLCRDTTTESGVPVSYEIVTVYENPQGDAEIIEAVLLPELAEVGGEAESGWKVNGGDVSLEANEKVRNAFEKSLEGVNGAKYEAVAYLASQETANGENHMIFCRVTPDAPDAVPFFSVATVYTDWEGNAEITDVTDMDFDEE